MKVIEVFMPLSVPGAAVDRWPNYRFPITAQDTFSGALPIPERGVLLRVIHRVDDGPEEFRAIVNIELAVDTLHACVDRVDRDSQPLRDLLLALALVQPEDDFRLILSRLSDIFALAPSAAVALLRSRRRGVRPRFAGSGIALLRPGCVLLP